MATLPALNREAPPYCRSQRSDHQILTQLSLFLCTCPLPVYPALAGLQRYGDALAIRQFLPDRKSMHLYRYRLNPLNSATSTNLIISSEYDHVDQKKKNITGLPTLGFWPE